MDTHDHHECHNSSACNAHQGHTTNPYMDKYFVDDEGGEIDDMEFPPKHFQLQLVMSKTANVVETIYKDVQPKPAE